MQYSNNQVESQFISQGRFTFLECDILGKGATGIVYKGHDNQENQSVAIKVIQTSKMNQIEKNLIQNEKKALRMLKNPNIMKLIHIEEQSSCTFIVSELYEGGNIQQFLSQRGSFSEQQAMEFFRKIINGYCAIVDANIIHRDLKPTNILLNKSSEPVIIDFGYSQIIVANRNLTVVNVGSPSYMSPQAFTKTIYSEKSDVWSLGAIFYQLLTNKTLDDNIPIHQYFQMLKKSEFPPIDFSMFSEVVRQILKSALAVKTQQRGTANRIKYLLDKEILCKRFQGKMITKANSFQGNGLRQTISNSNSVANFGFLNNQIDFFNMKNDDETTKMMKKPSMNKTFSSIPLNPQKSKRNLVHSVQSIEQNFMKKQDCIIEGESQTDSNVCSSSGHGSLNITPSVSRIQYLPIYEYQKSYGQIMQANHNQQNNRINEQYQSVQSSVSSQMIQMKNMHPKFQRQISINSNGSETQSFNYPSKDTKSLTYNQGFFNRNKNDYFIQGGNNQQKKRDKQQLFYSNQINPQQQLKYQTNESMRPNVPFVKNLSNPSQNYGKPTQRFNQNENYLSHKNFNPVNLKQLTQQLQGIAAVQSQNNFNGVRNYGLRQKNQYFQQSQKVYQPQKMYQSQQNSPYQRTNFQQALRSTITPQTQFNFQRVINNQPSQHNVANHNQMFNHNQVFGQSIRSTIDPSSRQMLGLRKIV